MRPLTAFFAFVLALGLFFLAARFLFFIWVIAAISGLFFFAFRGMRNFVLARRYEFPDGPYAQRPFALPERKAAIEPHLPDNIRYLHSRMEERTIEVR